MPTVVQLSDLHLLGAQERQQDLLDALVEAMAVERARRGQPADLLVVTGDVFDSSSLDPARAIGAFRDLHGRLLDALGGRVPTVVVPGNHDRRKMGLVGPHRQELFDHFAHAMEGEAFVHGSTVPFLSRVVDPAFHGLPCWLIAYDSTYLPRGLLSAGGALRQEDLLHAAAIIGDRHPEWPVLFLLHHHLVPTPLTDVGVIDGAGTPALVRWGLEHVLPALVANGDREELTMTALGSGTALSTLHSMQRAVVVLHGHKHYATARLLRGVQTDQGDVMIVSAGSAGTAQPWYPTTSREAAKLWPSFNILELEPDRLHVDDVSFGYGESRGSVVVRPMVAAGKDGPRWALRPVSGEPILPLGPRLERNHLACHLEPSDDGRRWHVHGERIYTGDAGAPVRFSDTVDALEDGRLALADPGGRFTDGPGLPAEIELHRDAPLRYRIEDGVCRVMGEAARLFGPRHSPYAWLGLMNRYASGEAVFEVKGPAGSLRDAFASETDLGNGIERPLRVQARSNGSDRIVVRYPDCPPRTLIRVYWRLERR